MTISGSSVHSEIKGKISDLESEIRESKPEIDKYENKITSLSEEREQIYTRLATTYLPELEAKSVQQTLSEVQTEVKKIFGEKQQRRQELETLIYNSQEKRKKFEEKLNETTSSLNEKAKERDKLRGEVAKELSSNSTYTEFDKNAKQAEERLKQNKARVKEVEEQAKEKLPAYEKNKIFKYLVKREFGTENYNKKGLTARLDSWVAEYIHFKEQKSNYDFLKAMPDLMAQEVSRRQGELDEVVQVMQEIEKSVSDKYGLTKVIEQGESLTKERSETIQSINKKDSEYQQYAQKRKELDSKKDPYHTEAIQKLKDFLKGEKISELKTRARTTPGTEDDRLADRIEEIDLKVRELKNKAKEIKTERDTKEKNLKGLREIESTYRQKDYESHRSYFDEDFNLNSLLIGYLAGKLSHNDILNTIESQHHFKPKETYHSSDDYDYSPSYHSSSSNFGFGSGGGFGGGGFSSGGGFGGGGFSSGHGF